MAPHKNIPVPICNTSHGKRDFVGTIKLRIVIQLRSRAYAGLSQCNHKGPDKGRRKAEEEIQGLQQMSEWSNGWKGATGLGMQAASRRWKRQGTDSPLEIPEGKQPQTLVSQDQCQTSALQSYKIINMCCFKPVSFVLTWYGSNRKPILIN